MKNIPLKFKRMSILVVDDEESIRNTLKSVLNRLDHDLTIAENGEQALELFKSNNFNLAIIDLIMPGGLQGLELFKSLRQINPDVCVIVLTRDNNIRSAVQVMKMGAYDYITKPCNDDEIEIVVKKAIERCGLLCEIEEKYHYKSVLISKSINDLESDDETTRRLAAEDLGEFRDEDAIDALLNCFNDQSVAVQEAAEGALIKIGGEQVVKKIIPMLQSKQANIRNFATEMLENLGKKALPTLSELIEDKDHDIRKFAVDVLGLISCAEGIEPLIKALDDPHVNVSSGAAEALGNIGDRQITEALLQRLDNCTPWLTYAIVDSLGKIRDERAVEPLIKLDHGDDPVLIMSKIRALGEIGDVKAVDFLFSLFEKGDEYLRVQIIESLQQIWERSEKNIFKDIDQDKFIRQLIPILNDSDAKLRLSIIHIISNMNCDNAVEALLPYLSDKDEEVLDVTCQAFLKIGVCGQAINLLLEKLSIGNDELKQVIIKLFGEAECSEAGDTIADLLKNHENSGVREEAANTLGLLKNKRKYAKNLIEALNDKSVEVKRNSVHSLGMIQDSETIGSLISVLGSKDITKEAIGALIAIGGDNTFNQILPLLKEVYPLRRAAAITILGSIRHKDITKYITESLSDKNSQVRKTTLDVIGKIEDDSFIEDLITSMHDEDKYVQIAAINALSKFDDIRIIDPLIAVLSHDQDARARYQSVQGLMRFKEERIVYALISSLSDRSNMVKIVALEALSEIGDESVICHIENMLEMVEDEELYQAAISAIGKLQFSE